MFVVGGKKRGKATANEGLGCWANSDIQNIFLPITPPAYLDERVLCTSKTGPVIYGCPNRKI